MYRQRSSSVTVHRIYKYLVGSLISSGSFSTIRAAMQPNSNGQCVIKIMSKKRLADNTQGNKIIFNETVISPLLKHPNIVTVKEVFQSLLQIFIVMDRYVDTLYHMLITRELDFVKKLQLIDDILAGVEYLHNSHMCHLDIKLENILIDADERARIGDFGFVTFADKKIINQFGSFGYAAPEIMKGIPFDGRKADMWSIGVLIYEIFKKQKPFDCNNEPDIDKVNFIGIPPDIERLLRSLLSVNPDERISITKLRNSRTFSVLGKEHRTPLKSLNGPMPPSSPEVLNYVCIAFDLQEQEAIDLLNAEEPNEVKVLYSLALEKIDERPSLKSNSESTFKSFSLPLDLLDLDGELDFSHDIIIKVPLNKMARFVTKHFVNSGFCVSKSIEGRYVAIHNAADKDVTLELDLISNHEGTRVVIASSSDSDSATNFIEALSNVC